MTESERKWGKIEYPTKPDTLVSYDHWYRVIEGIFDTLERGGSSALSTMAFDICTSLRIPVGPTSALTPPQANEAEAERTERMRRERVIGTVFSEYVGVYVGQGENKEGETLPVVTLGINTLLDAIERKERSIDVDFSTFMSALPESDRAIIEGERSLRAKMREEQGISTNWNQINRPLVYSRFPGGVGVFLRGYGHGSKWQRAFGDDLAKIYARASICAIEGFPNKPLGKSLPLQWADRDGQQGHYDVLIKAIATERAALGLPTTFAEVDARYHAVVRMDQNAHRLSVDLPDAFYQQHYAYLCALNPAFTTSIPTWQKLKVLLKRQSTSHDGVFQRDIDIQSKNTIFNARPSVSVQENTMPHMSEFNK